jgi:hypothetical protein
MPARRRTKDVQPFDPVKAAKLGNLRFALFNKGNHLS